VPSEPPDVSVEEQRCSGTIGAKGRRWEPAHIFAAAGIVAYPLDNGLHFAVDALEWSPATGEIG
jgi:hypothetical protein